MFEFINRIIKAASTDIRSGTTSSLKLRSSFLAMNEGTYFASFLAGMKYLPVAGIPCDICFISCTGLYQAHEMRLNNRVLVKT